MRRARSKNKNKKRQDSSRQKAVTAPAKRPSPLAVYVIKRLLVFNVASAILFLIGAVAFLYDLPGAERRLSSVPPALGWLFIGAWFTSTAYRFYLSSTRNPKIGQIVLDDHQTRRYATSQVASTLVSLMFALVAILYLSGIIQPVVNTVAGYIVGVDPTTIAAMLAVLASILWNIVASAIWDLAKWCVRRVASAKQ